MNSDRRTFLTMSLSVFGAPQLLSQSNDLVLQHITEEFGRLNRDLLTSGLRADTLAALARAFRLHLAHSRMTSLDTRLKRVTTRTVNRVGLEAVLDQAESSAMVDKHHQTMRSFGLDRLHPEPFSRDSHRQAIIRLETSGITSALQGAAEKLELMSATLARLTTPLGASRVQGLCQSFRAICDILGPAADAICAIALLAPELLPICALLQLEQAAACFIANMNGC